MENNVIIDIVSEKWENDAVEKVVKEKKPFELFGIIDALFVDKNKTGINLVNKNLEITGLSNNAKVIQSDFLSFATRSTDIFDIVFLDPPYAAGMLVDAVKSVIPLMSDYGMIICEYPPEVSMPEAIGNFTVYRTYRYGKINVTIYRKGL